MLLLGVQRIYFTIDRFEARGELNDVVPGTPLRELVKLSSTEDIFVLLNVVIDHLHAFSPWYDPIEPVLHGPLLDVGVPVHDVQPVSLFQLKGGLQIIRLITFNIFQSRRVTTGIRTPIKGETTLSPVNAGVMIP